MAAARHAPAISARERVYRARRISLTFGKIYLGAKGQQLIARHLRPPDMRERWSAFHHSSAESIYDAAIELHGLILKACQFLGARADVLPPEYVRVLSRLQDRVPPQPLRVVKRVIETELETPLDSVFPEFSARPVASASLAQVHRARLADGREVAVKVQYPGIAEQVRGDLANLRTLFRAVGWLESDFDLMPLMDELGTHLPRELDFLQEGRNAETVAKRLETRSDVVVPGIVWEHTTPRVLVMQFLDGIKVTELDELAAAKIDVDAVSRSLIEIFAEQILRHGFFHADPHPGNLLVLPDGRVGLIDFGLSKELPPHFREGVVGFLTALMAADPDAMGRALVELGFETRNADPNALGEIAGLVLRVGQTVRERGSLDPELVAELRREIPDRIRANPIIRVPHHLVLLGRVIGLLSGLTRSLGGRVDLFRTLLPYVAGSPPAPR